MLDCAILEHSYLRNFKEGPPLKTAWKLKLVSLLLITGDNPNRGDYLKTTPWSRVIRRMEKEHLQMEQRKLRMRSSAREQSRIDYWLYVVELLIRHGADPWVGLDTNTSDAFRTYDQDSEKKLETILKKKRRSWSQLRFAIAGR